MPHPFLQALESVRGWTASAYVWKRHLGDAFARASGWLFDPTGAEVDHVPCYGTCRRAHRVVTHDRDARDVVAVSETLDSECQPVPLTVADIAEWSVAITAFLDAIAESLGASGPIRAHTATPAVYHLGDVDVDGDKRSAYFAAAYDDTAYEAMIDGLAPRHQGAVLYAPLSRPTIRSYAEDAGLLYRSLDTFLDFGRDLHPRRRAKKPSAPPSSPYAAKGSRWAISRAFNEVVNMKTGARTILTTPRAREALRILVEYGALDREHGLTKKLLCEAVYERLQPTEKRPKSYKPIQFFRVRRKDKTVRLPIYRQIVRDDGRGYYWLEL